MVPRLAFRRPLPSPRPVVGMSGASATGSGRERSDRQFAPANTFLHQQQNEECSAFVVSCRETNTTGVAIFGGLYREIFRFSQGFTLFLSCP